MVTIKDINKDHVTGFLGNKLFQIAAAYDLAQRNGDELILPHFEFERLFHNKFFTVVDESKLTIESEYQEPFFHHKEIPYQKNMNLNGYFQSPKYFDDWDTNVIFAPNFELKYNIFKTLIPALDMDYETLFAYNRTCGLHVRRGDFSNHPNHHPILPIEYYNEAISMMPDVDYFVICSNDIDWCKQNFKGPKFVFSETAQELSQGNRNAAFDLFLMSFCSYNIIANSSFSWWSAYLNNSAGKKVICPGNKYRWFGPALSHDLKDLYPEEWNKYVSG